MIQGKETGLVIGRKRRRYNHETTTIDIDITLTPLGEIPRRDCIVHEIYYNGNTLFSSRDNGTPLDQALAQVRRDHPEIASYSTPHPRAITESFGARAAACEIVPRHHHTIINALETSPPTP